MRLIVAGMMLGMTVSMVLAADVSSIEKMEKQGGKIATTPDDPTKAKNLCLCHFNGGGQSIMGVLQHETIEVAMAGNQAVKVDCLVATYFQGVPSFTRCANLAGTSWEIVK